MTFICKYIVATQFPESFAFVHGSQNGNLTYAGPIVYTQIGYRYNQTSAPTSDSTALNTLPTNVWKASSYAFSSFSVKTSTLSFCTALSSPSKYSGSSETCSTSFVL